MQPSTWLDRLTPAFDHPRFGRRLAALVALLCAPALTVGYRVDDWMQQALLRGVDPAVDAGGGPRSPLRHLFAFADGDPTHNLALVDAGILPWWVPQDVMVQLWRPLSVTTHQLDHALAPGVAAVAHAQSIAWMVALAGLAWALYRRLLPGRVAALAALLYAVDEAHGYPVGWLANRNALICGVLGIAAVIAHDRWRRDGWTAGAVLGPLALGAGLLAGEGALAATAWLFAHAVFVDRASVRSRAAALLPYAAVAVAWRATYDHLGFGSHGSGLYLDPVASPGAYAALLPRRLVALLGDQFLSFPSMNLPFVPNPAATVLVVMLAAALVGLAWALAPALRGRALGFWATGGLLSLLPVAATFPAPRLLTFAGLSGTALLALAIDAALRAGAALPRRTRTAAAAMLLLHGPVAALGLAVQSRGVVTLAELMFEPCDDRIPTDPSVAEQTWVFVNSNDLCVSYIRHRRAARGLPAPRGLLLMGSAIHDLTVDGVDEHTVELSIPAGMQSEPPDQLLRDPAHPLPVGTQRTVAGVAIEVLSHNADGLADRVRFRFPVPLQDPSLRWVCTRGLAPATFAPPAPGEQASLPGALSSLLGAAP